MKKFVIRVLAFLIFVAIFFGAVVGICVMRLDSTYIYQLETDIRYIIVGDSHTQFAVNDSLLAGGLNISNSADSYLYSYLKIGKLLSENDNLQGVLLGYSEHNLGLAMEAWNFRDENLASKASQYLHLMNWSEVRFLGSRNPVAFMTGTVRFPKMKLNVLKALNASSRITDIGVGRTETLTQKVQDWKGFGKKYDMDSVFSQSQQVYLEKIVKLCEDHHVKLILLTTPLHSTYPHAKQPLDSVFYADHLQGITWLNLRSEPLPDSCFADFEHLNEDGARIFTLRLKQKLQEIL